MRLLNHALFITMTLQASACISLNAQDLTYEKNINQAELAIVDSLFDKAREYYHTAFGAGHSGFAEDYNNALKLAVLIGDVDLAFFSAGKLAERGLCLEFFQQIPLLTSDSSRWQKLLNAINYQSGYNYDYRSALNRLFYRDQDARQGWNDPQEIKEVDSLNYLAFKELVELYGYPSEDLIGIECSAGSDGIYIQPHSALLSHFAQRKFPGIEQLLKEALFHRAIDRHQYADFMSSTESKKVYMPNPVVKIGNAYYQYKVSEVKLLAINKDRMEIGLPPIEDEIRMIMDKIKNGRREFRFHTLIDLISPPPPPEILEKMFVMLSMD